MTKTWNCDGDRRASMLFGGFSAKDVEKRSLWQFDVPNLLHLFLPFLLTV